MNTLTLEEIPGNVDLIPRFSELKETPKSNLDAVWILGVSVLPLVLWSLKAAISNKLEQIKNEQAVELEEQKIELAQRDSLIKHLQDQNNRLINEIFILRRTMDYSGNLIHDKNSQPQ